MEPVAIIRQMWNNGTILSAIDIENNEKLEVGAPWDTPSRTVVAEPLTRTVRVGDAWLMPDWTYMWGSTLMSDRDPHAIRSRRSKVVRLGKSYWLSLPFYAPEETSIDHALVGDKGRAIIESPIYWYNSKRSSLPEEAKGLIEKGEVLEPLVPLLGYATIDLNDCAGIAGTLSIASRELDMRWWFEVGAFKMFYPTRRYLEIPVLKAMTLEWRIEFIVDESAKYRKLTKVDEAALKSISVKSNPL